MQMAVVTGCVSVPRACLSRACAVIVKGGLECGPSCEQDMLEPSV